MVHYRQQALQAGRSPSSSGRSARYSQLPRGHNSTGRFRSRNPQQPLARQSRLRHTEEVSLTQSNRSPLPSQEGAHDHPDDSNAYDSVPQQSDDHRLTCYRMFTVDDDPFSPAMVDEQVTGSRSSAVSHASESIRSFNRSMNDRRVSDPVPSLAGSGWTGTMISNDQSVPDLRGLERSKDSFSSFN